MRGAVAAPIDQVERLAGVGQRDDQDMIAPDSIVADVDALFALGAGADEGAVEIHDRLAEEVGGLLGPDPQPGRIDRLHQGEDIGFLKPPAEVTLGGGVGDAFGAEGIEIDGIVAPQLDVFEAAATGEDIERNVQNMVGFVIRKVAFEEMEVEVDEGDQARAPCQHHHGADAAGRKAVNALAEFVVDVGGGHHGRTNPMPTVIITPEPLFHANGPEVSLLRAAGFDVVYPPRAP